MWFEYNVSKTASKHCEIIQISLQFDCHRFQYKANFQSLNIHLIN